uniref:Adenylosuccinate synthetase n=1 Tax=Solibacter usitatus (strain Ellin6076) TaxID=234267 RepID=Q01T19_SOLUE
MFSEIVLLSGPVASGKSTLAYALVRSYGFDWCKTRELIQRLKSTKGVRSALQTAGDGLDRRTKGEWIATAVAERSRTIPENARIVVDAVRAKSQIDAVRRAFGPLVVHIHLTAPEEDLRQRYENGRSPSIEEFSSYAEVRQNKTERFVERLADVADIVINTGHSTEEDVLVRVASRLGLYGRSVDRLVDVLVGGQYGSEGKGHVASYLAPEYDFLVRAGGPNAGHTVYEEPNAYAHHQLPSGTRFSNSKLVIAPGAVLAVEKLLKEIADCQVDNERLTIDPQAMIIEPGDISFEEKGLKNSIGSTAQGVGSASSRKILRTAARPKVKLAKDVVQLRPFVKETLGILERAFARGQRVFLEGTQGTGLSIHHGFYPYVTSRETSVSGCLAEAGIAPTRVRRTIIAVRSYPIRVESPMDATSGPMKRELDWATISFRSGIPVEELEEKEKTTTTKKRRRVAEFDWSLLRKSASLNGPTDVALTFVDYINVHNRKARRFEQLTSITVQLIEEIERVAAAPVSLITTRFDYRSIIDRRAW